MKASELKVGDVITTTYQLHGGVVTSQVTIIKVEVNPFGHIIADAETPDGSIAQLQYMADEELQG